MTEFIMFVVPEDISNGKGKVVFHIWDEKKQVPTNEVMEKNFSIGVWSDAHSLMKEGRAYIKGKEDEIIKELEEMGYKKVKLSFGN